MKRKSLVNWTLIAIACAVGPGCTGANPEESLAAAKAYLAKGEGQSALIELKNTLQAKPDSAEARFLLGKMLLDREDPVGAAVELQKASDLGYTPDAVAPLLAKAYVDSGEFRKVVELESHSVVHSPAAQAALKTEVAYAHRGLGNAARAEAAVVAALQSDPQYAPAQILQARSIASKGEPDAAMKLVDEVLARQPADLGALLLRAQLLQSRGKSAEALDDLHKALAVRPDYIPAHKLILNYFLDKDDLAAARQQLDAFKKVRPGHPQTIYFEARLAAQQGDLKAADESVKLLLKGFPANPEVLQLAGIVALRKGELQQAEQHFGKLLQILPAPAASARQMLARIAIGRGEPGKALEILGPLLESAKPDAATLSIAGAARMQSGEISVAEDLFARAVKQSPGDASSRTALAIAHLARGDSAGLDQLEAIAGSEAGGAAELVLISANFNRRNFEAALKGVDKLLAKKPSDPALLNLRGQILVGKGDLPGARASFEAATAGDTKFFPAVAWLAQLDVREKKPEVARARIEAVVKAEPQNAQALLALATIDERADKPEADVAAEIAKAVAASPSDPKLRVRLVDYYLAKGNAKAALAAAQEAAGAMPNEPLVVNALARAHFRAGERLQALAAFNRLAALLPKAPEPLLAVAGVELAGGDATAAMATLKRAVALAPDHPIANRRAVELLVARGRFDEAASVARDFLARRPDLALGDELLGDIERRQGRAKEAVVRYQAALRKQPSSALVQKLHATQLLAAQTAQAKATEQEWLKEQPNDTAFLMYLGGVAARAKNYDIAQARFSEILKLEPENALALNNLAYVLHAQNKPGALELAERANKLEPDAPAILDTFAQILADSGQVEKALAMQKRALEKSPNSSALRLTLAKIYLKAGDKTAARGELEQLRRLGPEVPERAEAETLLGRL